jgi:hypothetical protein
MPGHGVVVSGSADVFEGARAALLHVDGLFRLDVVVVPDSLRLLVRNLSGAALSFEPEGYPRPVVIQGGMPGEMELMPGHHQLSFALSGPEAAVEARVTLATLRLPESGTVSITAQGLLRRMELAG